MKYDDSSWHYESDDFPKNLPETQGGIHIGMFLAWVILNNGSAAVELTEEASDLQKVKDRKMTGTEFLFKYWDGKLISTALNDEMNAFTSFYWMSGENPNQDYDQFFEENPDHNAAGNYIEDFSKTLNDTETTYHVRDTWENFDLISPVITRRYQGWKTLPR